VDEPTEVMPLDQLMDLASEPATVPIRRSPAPTPAPAPTPSPSSPTPVPTLQDLRKDVAAAAQQVRTWLRRGDNTLIALTVAAALILLIVVGVA